MTKQFVRTEDFMRETRDASGTQMAQYFVLGQVSNGANYFYHLNRRGDVIAVTDSSGSQVNSIAYDSYGRSTLPSGSVVPEFGFTGLYIHQRSGLNLALYRVYCATIGRWVNRDPILENGGVNLYGYVGNSPVDGTDASGLFHPITIPTIPDPDDSARTRSDLCLCLLACKRQATPLQRQLCIFRCVEDLDRLYQDHLKNQRYLQLGPPASPPIQPVPFNDTPAPTPIEHQPIIPPVGPSPKPVAPGVP